MRRICTSRWRSGRVVVGVLVGLLALAAAALAADPLNGRLYVGPVRQAPLPYGGRLSRVLVGRGLVFAVSGDGRTMQFRGRTAFTETCSRNGRFAGRFEALVVQRKPNGNTSIVPAPVVRIRPDGTFYGAGSHSFKPRAARRETLHYHFAGRFTGTGRSAVGRFFVNHCSSPPFHLTALASASPKAAIAAASSGLVAAYGFDEGSGSTVDRRVGEW